MELITKLHWAAAAYSSARQPIASWHGARRRCKRRGTRELRRRGREWAGVMRCSVRSVSVGRWAAAVAAHHAVSAAVFLLDSCDRWLGSFIPEASLGSTRDASFSTCRGRDPSPSARLGMTKRQFAIRSTSFGAAISTISSPFIVKSIRSGTLSLCRIMYSDSSSSM